MQLRYEDASGQTVIVELGSAQSITAGRDPSCDVVVHDEKASRRHCEIRLWEDKQEPSYVEVTFEDPTGGSVILRLPSVIEIHRTELHEDSNLKTVSY